ncbi:hypothetical protein QJQ45_010990 [Haematococcus lacustris]|nr:hypothetical protein QJQ45_010990 [Haematococcus lacustris]
MAGVEASRECHALGTHMSDLSDDVFGELLRHLPAAAVGRIACTCKRLNQLTSIEVLGGHAMRRDRLLFTLQLCPEREALPATQTSPCAPSTKPPTHAVPPSAAARDQGAGASEGLSNVKSGEGSVSQAPSSSDEEEEEDEFGVVQPSLEFIRDLLRLAQAEEAPELAPAGIASFDPHDDDDDLEGFVDDDDVLELAFAALHDDIGDEAGSSDGGYFGPAFGAR